MNIPGTFVVTTLTEGKLPPYATKPLAGELQLDDIYSTFSVFQVCIINGYHVDMYMCDTNHT